MNAVEIEAAVSDLAEAPFDAEEFPYAFLAAFGNKDTTIARLRKGDTNKSDVPGGVLQRSHIHLATCAPGQVNATLNALRASPETTKGKVKFILATDGDTLEAEELANGETIASEYAKFAGHFGFFLPLAGISTIKEIKDSAIDVRATGRLNKLYLELLRENPDWATDERRQDMNHFMARLIFCFFAEDTGIFDGRGLFTKTVDRMSDAASGNTHEVIGTIFQAMNVPTKDSSARTDAKIPGWADAFPYVNGGLFGGSNEVPRFTRMARTYLLHAGNLDWHEINPDIFGSMIQAVADDEERGSLGMHYTSVPNILKALNPLFLDDLRAQLDAAGDNKAKLLNLRKRMARIRVFDPACGSGNFLVIAYKQMREIEAEINRRREEPADMKSVIPLTNFRGIELRSFPAEIARLALIIAEYQCDVLYRGQMQAVQDFLPLEAENWITNGNALRLDWLKICPPTGTGVKVIADDLFQTPLDQPEIDFENEGGETYICGNPPYLGSKKKNSQQIDDMAIVGLGTSQLLDYVAAFIVKGADYVCRTSSKIALVSTSSICQGEQVSLLWPRLLKDVQIAFAYRPFKWANSAAKNAGVWCTIVGLETKPGEARHLYFEDSVRVCKNISPYLIPGENIVCAPSSEPISSISAMKMGSNAVDGKKLIVPNDRRLKIIAEYPDAHRFFKKYGGTKELVAGNFRWCLWVEDEDLDEVDSIPSIKSIIEECRIYREGAGRDAKKAAKRPYAFCYSTYEDKNFIQVGNTIGNGYPYVPADIKRHGFVSNHNAFTIYDAGLVEFAVVSSTLHRVWAEAVSGRLGDGVRYGNTVVYNTFPLPRLTEQNIIELTRTAEDILLAREAHFPKTIGDLYKSGDESEDESTAMPENLCRAHERNDEVLERIYIGRRFRNDTERLEKLFDLYAKMTAAETKPTKKTIRARKTA